MKIYPWDEVTKEALSPVEKPDNHPNPIGRCETITAPPAPNPEGHIARAVLTDEGWFDHWEVVIDRRGAQCWLSNGSPCTIDEIGIDIPDGVLTTPPPSALYTTHDESLWIIDMEALSNQIRAERDGKLTAFYAPVIQQLTRWIDEAEGDPAALTHYKSQRTAWHAWADALCDLPDQPGWPWPEGDVPWPEHPPKPTRYTAP